MSDTDVGFFAFRAPQAQAPPAVAPPAAPAPSPALAPSPPGVRFWQRMIPGTPFKVWHGIAGGVAAASIATGIVLLWRGRRGAESRRGFAMLEDERNWR